MVKCQCKDTYKNHYFPQKSTKQNLQICKLYYYFFHIKKKKHCTVSVRCGPLGIKTIIINQRVSSQCQALLPVGLTTHFLQRKIASEVRHLMRQCKCHARWLSLLIRLNSSHVAFDQEVMTGSQGPVNCFQYQWTH